MDWNGLQVQLRQQYSRKGNTREHLFHAWRSVHFDGNSKTIDNYVTYISQVAAILGYGESQVLEVL